MYLTSSLSRRMAWSYSLPSTCQRAISCYDRVATYSWCFQASAYIRGLRSTSFDLLSTCICNRLLIESGPEYYSHIYALIRIDIHTRRGITFDLIIKQGCLYSWYCLVSDSMSNLSMRCYFWVMHTTSVTCSPLHHQLGFIAVSVLVLVRRVRSLRSLRVYVHLLVNR